jgi:putative ABC transport system substrate-binding protein
MRRPATLHRVQRAAAIAVGTIWLIGCGLPPSGAHPRTARFGWLATDPQVNAPQPEAFRNGLREAGWVDGQNLALDLRWWRDRPATIDILASEMGSSAPDVIVTTVTPAALALVDPTTTIPIVIVGGSGPVSSGLAASLSHPGET